MILMKLKNYIRGRESVGLKELSRVFTVSPDALQPMLAVWIQKGCLRECPTTSSCSGACGQCPLSQAVRYQWIER